MSHELSGASKEKVPGRLELAGILGGAAIFITAASAAGAYAATLFEKASEQPEKYIDGLFFSNATMTSTLFACGLHHAFHKKRELRKQMKPGK